jgi:hypothetical protein
MKRRCCGTAPGEPHLGWCILPVAEVGPAPGVRDPFPVIDYATLLRKYMAFVVAEESITFLDRVTKTGHAWAGGEDVFTVAELVELQRIERTL